MTKKKSIFFIIILNIAILIFIIVINLIFCRYKLINIHKEIIEESHDYKLDNILSDDGNFIIKTVKNNDKTGTYLMFYVECISENKIIYRCNDKYRTFDLKNIKWDLNNIVIESADIGTIIYYFDGNTWNKEKNNLTS